AFGARAFPRPAADFEEAALALRSFDRVCMGGTHPGHTTDAVGAMLAERVHAERLVIVTNVDGVYTSDPNKDPDAERVEQLTPDELLKIVGGARQAGSSGVVDPLAAQLLGRSHLPAAVVGGSDALNVARAINGEDFVGTRVEE
ncbi:MAG: UMP kinase, partial [Candidatus Thermoplasmatota archaeon]|nr:UMP kinase [Candidatus Thermoplasmatota archaeon]